MEGVFLVGRHLENAEDQKLRTVNFGVLSDRMFETKRSAYCTVSYCVTVCTTEGEAGL